MDGRTDRKSDIKRWVPHLITENIRKALDDGNIACGVFVDLQKAFDTGDHQILSGADLGCVKSVRLTNAFFMYNIY